MTALYKDPQHPVADRVADLLARMTPAEKIAQMHAFWLLLSPDGEHRVREDAFTGKSDPATLQNQLRLGLGQITRPLGSHTVDARTGVQAFNRLQRFMLEETRLGIPVMAHEECLLGLMSKGATLFPSPLAMSATWNPALIEHVAALIGDEARSVGCHQGLAPVLDVSRDVRWGRTEETFGEDPYLVGVLATRYVRGLQGPRRDLFATLKHYVGHSFSEGARNHAPVHLGWRELNDTFLLPFEMAVKQANAGSVMPAYHDIDNEPSHASRHLLTEVLREQWGFDGLVVADYVGVSLLYQHHGLARDQAEAAALAFNAGLDIELPGDDCAAHLHTAVERGLISPHKIDEIVARILQHKFELGLFEHPYADENNIRLRSPAALAAAREVAQQSIVILENNGILPLAPAQQNIAVIGPTANDALAMLGGYSFPVHLILSEAHQAEQAVITPLAGLQARYGAEHVSYAQGCAILDERVYGTPVFPGDVADSSQLLQQSAVSHNTDGIAAAVALAQAADVAIVCVGDLAGLFQTGTVGEGSDTDSLNLPGVQQQLLQAVVETGKPVIVVLTGGRPYNLQGLEQRVAALLMAFTGGQEAGPALAAVLAGDAAPSGRLTVSVPKSVGAMPYYYNHKLKSAGTPVAFHFGSAYPFGYGLGYTQFDYADLQIEASEVDIDAGDIVFSFSVRNTGARAGVVVPQIYVRDQFASLVRPVKELKGFARLHLAAGEVRTLQARIPVDMLNFTGYSGQRIVEPGQFELMVGEHSADIRLRAVVNVTGRERTLGRDWRMESTVIAL
ncbi:glycoside hydrolase family 3 N-terminal domain-containing protein [Amantichitinum ursilacus]|uniref:Beta-D-glucoside glucohydrolase n=1 Tax=Amantichitinum ursilacus TaxID=857265 RepID=A0A0N0GL35_9NEIS|nr:glycoside hydrolase family 3 N-terminal domain-containing protein [Amantichitinum ursilacus]KPC49576.1 Periplasmic beta-glucosidase precursor [Amantichitinum ursilacus]